MTRLKLDSISVFYGDSRILDAVNLDVADGEFLALLGPSGCGKTTLLKTVAGLILPAGGDIQFDSQSILAIPAEARSAAMVFQKPLLFPHLTVRENVAFGLTMKGLPKTDRHRLAENALNLVQLSGYGDRKPAQLSGGQEQRASLARALVTGPRLLLLDEPFSALDESLRREMRELVRDLQRRLGITTIFVTHDQEEALSVSDRIALMHRGRIEQVGLPGDFYKRPANSVVAQFFGWCVIPGTASKDSFTTTLGELVMSGISPSARAVAFLPDTVSLVPEPGSPEWRLRVDVKDRVDFGVRIRYRLALGEGVELTANSAQKVEGNVTEIAVPEKALVFLES